MRLISVTLCAVSAAAATLFPATAAMAGDAPGMVTVSPSVIAPGEVVDLRVHCDGRRVVGASEAFTAHVAFAASTEKGAMFGQARIRSDVPAKNYAVAVRCRGRMATGMLSVVQQRVGMPLPTPTAPVHAGGGATAALVAAQGGTETRNAVVGLVLAGTAALTVAARSIRRRRDVG
ncbi:hypothetical protein [Streptomyces sp. NBC_00344]|uniref:hypothetical protein n=1 Tax=Streptomyces sp. NBC_00344 TaxID=2975720 RepID=UPI002E1AB12A